MLVPAAGCTSKPTLLLSGFRDCADPAVCFFQVRQAPVASARLVTCVLQSILHMQRACCLSALLWVHTRKTTLSGNLLQQGRRTLHAFACILDSGLLVSFCYHCATCSTGALLVLSINLGKACRRLCLLRCVLSNRGGFWLCQLFRLFSNATVASGYQRQTGAPTDQHVHGHRKCIVQRASHALQPTSTE